MNKFFLILVFCFLIGFHSQSGYAQASSSFFPTLHGSTHKPTDTLGMVFHVALGDVTTSIRNHKAGLLTQPVPCLYAGIDYYGPWTRDAALNIWSSAGLIFPDVARNTLSSLIKTDANGEKLIDGEYWDCMIFTLGAWEYYLATGDKAFLQTALEVSENMIAKLEKDEYDSQKGLFRGGAFFQDGISAYPDLYSKTGTYTGGNWVSNIKKWVEENPDKKATPGFGLPMFALSSNALYYQAYTLLPQLAAELGVKARADYRVKAARLKKAINKHCWMPQKQTYRYLVDPNGNSDRQEGAGLAFALLFGIADASQAQSVFKNTYVAPAGIPCIYPSFERYTGPAGKEYARHSGTIWPQVQGLWAQAAIKYNQVNTFQHELNQLMRNAYRDKQFREIYHPLTGEPYGGYQEDNNGKVVLWKSTEKQVWSATAYLAMVLKGIIGMQLQPEGILFSPLPIAKAEPLYLRNLHYRDAVLDIALTGTGSQVMEFRINGVPQTRFFLPASAKGKQKIEIEFN